MGDFMCQEKGTRESRVKYPRCLSSRCTEEDYARVEHAAAVAGMSVCAYVRKRTTGEHVTAKINVQTLGELRRVGGLLKKLWVSSESDSATAGEVSTTLNELRSVLAELRAATKKNR